MKKVSLILALLLFNQVVLAEPEPADTSGLCSALSERLHSVNKAGCGQGVWKKSGESAGGHPLVFTEAGPKEGQRVLLAGPLDGRYLTGVSTLMSWRHALAADPQGVRYRLIPVPNPDGVLSRPAQAVNGQGRALFESFPPKGGCAGQCPPETQWLINQIKAFKPALIVQVGAAKQAAATKVVRPSALPETTLAGYLARVGGISLLQVHPDSSVRMPPEKQIKKGLRTTRKSIKKILNLTKTRGHDRGYSR